MRLYINIDHVATVRQARRAAEPDPVPAAALAEAAGADGITAHLREDRRHIQDHDVVRLLAATRGVFNLEMAVAEEIVALAVSWRPPQVTLVPERREEVTTEGGLDCERGRARLAEVLGRLKAAGIRTSLFITPDAASIDAACALAPDAVELHTGRYAHSWQQGPAALDELVAGTARARAAGVAVHAGHGLDYRNTAAVAAIPGIEELNIGHAVVSRAVLVGMGAAVRELRTLIDLARGDT